MIQPTGITVRYAETDQMGVVHHATYPIWYEAARTDWVRQAIGLRYSEMEAMGIGLPVVKLGCHYLQPARYEDELEVSVTVAQCTPARIAFCYTVTRKGEDKPLNTGYTLHAWVGGDLRPLNLKKRFPELYEQVKAFEQPQPLE